MKKSKFILGLVILFTIFSFKTKNKEEILPPTLEVNITFTQNLTEAEKDLFRIVFELNLGAFNVSNKTPNTEVWTFNNGINATNFINTYNSIKRDPGQTGGGKDADDDPGIPSGYTPPFTYSFN